MNRVTRIAIEFENGITNWIDLEDAEEWYNAIDTTKLPKKVWVGSRQTPVNGYLDNVFKVIEEHLGIKREALEGFDVPNASLQQKHARAFAAYMAWYREPHATLYNLASYFKFPMAGDLGIHMLKTLLKEATELRKDKVQLELLYKMLYALRDLDFPTSNVVLL